MKFNWLRSLFSPRSAQGLAGRARRPFRKETARRRPRPGLEALERRELLAADAPFIVQQLSVPADGSTPAGNPPAIIVTYSEPMKAAEVTNPANYLLFNSGGDPITINSVAPHPGMPTGYDIFYNSNDPLPADTYTLFVRGDQIHDVDD